MSIFFKHDEFSLLNNSVVHGFFGSEGGVSKGLYSSLNCGLGSDDHPANVRANRVLALEALDLDKTDLHNVHQIHSNKCVIIDGEQERPAEADALVTDKPGHTISILTADCTPVLFQGKKANGDAVIGAAHAGWKGAVSGVLQNTVKSMQKLGADVKTITAVIGPTIGPESYEVGAEFKENFIQTNPSFGEFFQNRKSSIYFDLPSFCKSRLEETGIKDIKMKNLDTFFHENDFFSYRRATHRKDKDYGRQISMISII